MMLLYVAVVAAASLFDWNLCYVAMPEGRYSKDAVRGNNISNTKLKAKVMNYERFAQEGDLMMTRNNVPGIFVGVKKFV